MSRDQVVVPIVSDDGWITSYATDEDGRFGSGTVTETGIRFFSLGGVVPYGDGWLAVGSGGVTDVGGDTQPVFAVRVFRSPDGRSWSEVEASGLDGPADVSGLAVADGRLVAVGTERGADDPSQGGFRPVTWHSDDGGAWTRVDLPADGASEGSVAAVAVVGDEVLAVGGLDRRGAMWSSADGGRTWDFAQRKGVPATVALSSVVVDGAVVLLSGMAAGGPGEEGRQLLLRSADGGRIWREAAKPPPPNRGEPISFPLNVGGGRFFTFGYSFIGASADPEVCYADIELCRRGTSISLYVSDDGDRWSRVDTSGIGEGEAGEVDQIVGTEDGRLFALTRVANGIGAWTWPAGAALPTEDEPADPKSEVDLLGEGETPVRGRRYAVPLHIHCGMDWLYVGGEPWQRTDDGPGVGSGAGEPVPEGWPVVQQTILGFVTLVADDRIEYSIGDGEVIATYAPATSRPPGCD